MHLDMNDSLASLRAAFHPPRTGKIHLDGSSIGAMPSTLPERMIRFLLEEWNGLRSHGWMEGDWLGLPRRLGDRLAPLIGAREGEVIFCDSTSINLFKLLLGALNLQKDRHAIISEKDNFPTDLYVPQGVIRLLGQGHELRLVHGEEGIEKAVDEDTAVIMLTHVDYRTGRRHDMARVNKLAHDHGALILWDLSHSAGAIPVDLNGTGADLATGCGYKYLNGGPGAPAYVWVTEGLQQNMQPAITGWMSHAERAKFESTYRPASGIERNLVGAPVVLGLLALEESLRIWDRVDLDLFFKKSQALSNLLIELVDRECSHRGMELVSPREAGRRGAHVAFRHEEAEAIVRSLERRGVIGGFRLPDIIRLGIAPLSLRYVDIWDAVAHLSDILGSEQFCEV